MRKKLEKCLKVRSNSKTIDESVSDFTIPHLKLYSSKSTNIEDTYLGENI